MSTNLNKMSIKDYFKHLYDEIIKNRSDNDVILSRIPSLILNHSKSIGAYEDLNYNLDKSSGNSAKKFYFKSLI